MLPALRRAQTPTMAALALYGALLLAWESAVRLDLIASDSVPSASQVVIGLVDLAGQGDYWLEIAQTLLLWAGSLTLAVLIGGGIGVLMGWSSTVYSALNTLVECLRPVPTVALIPVVVLLYGTYYRSALVLATLAAMWPILVHAVYGIRSTDQLTMDMARVFQLPKLTRLRMILLPSAAPSIASGVHVASGIALILVVTTGIIVGTPGIGDSITRAANSAAYAESYALVVTAGLLGILVNLGLGRLLARTTSRLPALEGSR